MKLGFLAAFSWRVWIAIIVALGLFFALVAVHRSNEAKRTADVYFHAHNLKVKPIRLNEPQAALIRELASRLRNHSPGKITHTTFKMGGVGFFQIGAERFHWLKDALWCRDRGNKGFVVVSDPRLGSCYEKLRSKYFEFDPDMIPAEEWQAALSNL